MKRMNVVVDEELLERARQHLGEKTYSATLNKALEGVVKQKRFREALERFQALAAEGPVFWPGYLEEIRPNAYDAQKPRKRAVSAHEKRVPRKKRG